VKVEGFGRYYMCTCDVKVAAKGVVRNPPTEWVLKLVETHANRADGKRHGYVNSAALSNSIIENNLIKIPDVYEIELQFKPLLPQNFNTYLYRFSQNARIENQFRGGSLWKESAVSPAKFHDWLMADFAEYSDKGLQADIDAWKAGKKPALI